MNAWAIGALQGTVYITLRHHYDAGDYSAVMVIEARLRQLRCLPTRGGVHVTDFVTTWHTSINQMEAASFLPGTRQLLSIFVDSLPNSTVAFINLYDDIMSSLNEPLEQSLPNIHYLFDRTIQIDNNIQRNRILHPTIRHPLQSQQSVPATMTPNTTTVSTPVSKSQGTRTDRQTTTLICSNCGRPGHNVPTCFQPGGGMEGRREEYLASRPPRPIAHIAEIEDNTVDVEEDTVVVEENALNNEFAAMSLNVTNEIEFSTYVLASFSEISNDPLAFNTITQAYNSALDSACTQHAPITSSKTVNSSTLTTLRAQFW